jgi:hypothetical protein
MNRLTFQYSDFFGWIMPVITHTNQSPAHGYSPSPFFFQRSVRLGEASKKSLLPLALFFFFFFLGIGELPAAQV